MRTFIRLIMCGLLSTSVWAGGVPKQITYQGAIKEHGLPVNGPLTMAFRITNQEGTVVYWSSGNMDVQVHQGLFSALLAPAGVDWQNAVPYIEVSVKGQLLSPREPLTSSAYAFMCGSVADGSVLKGMIAMFREECPAGWTRFKELDNRFPVGGMSYGATGGATMHTHALGPATHMESDWVFNDRQGGGSHQNSFALSPHVHTVSTESNLPPYLAVVFCEKL